jgi:hypothetical protein
MAVARRMNGWPWPRSIFPIIAGRARRAWYPHYTPDATGYHARPESLVRGVLCLLVLGSNPDPLAEMVRFTMSAVASPPNHYQRSQC